MRLGKKKLWAVDNFGVNTLMLFKWYLFKQRLNLIYFKIYNIHDFKIIYIVYLKFKKRKNKKRRYRYKMLIKKKKSKRIFKEFWNDEGTFDKNKKLLKMKFVRNLGGLNKKRRVDVIRKLIFLPKYEFKKYLSSHTSNIIKLAFFNLTKLNLLVKKKKLKFKKNKFNKNLFFKRKLKILNKKRKKKLLKKLGRKTEKPANQEPSVFRKTRRAPWAKIHSLLFLNKDVGWKRFFKKVLRYSFYKNKQNLRYGNSVNKPSISFYNNRQNLRYRDLASKSSTSFLKNNQAKFVNPFKESNQNLKYKNNQNLKYKNLPQKSAAILKNNQVKLVNSLKENNQNLKYKNLPSKPISTFLKNKQNLKHRNFSTKPTLIFLKNKKSNLKTNSNKKKKKIKILKRKKFRLKKKIKCRYKSIRRLLKKYKKKINYKNLFNLKKKKLRTSKRTGRVRLKVTKKKLRNPKWVNKVRLNIIQKKFWRTYFNFNTNDFLKTKLSLNMYLKYGSLKKKSNNLNKKIYLRGWRLYLLKKSKFLFLKNKKQLLFSNNPQLLWKRKYFLKRFYNLKSFKSMKFKKKFPYSYVRKKLFFNKLNNLYGSLIKKKFTKLKSNALNDTKFSFYKNFFKKKKNTNLTLKKKINKNLSKIKKINTGDGEEFWIRSLLSRAKIRLAKKKKIFKNGRKKKKIKRGFKKIIIYYFFKKYFTKFYIKFQNILKLNKRISRVVKKYYKNFWYYKKNKNFYNLVTATIFSKIFFSSYFLGFAIAKIFRARKNHGFILKTVARMWQFFQFNLGLKINIKGKWWGSLRTKEKFITSDRSVRQSESTLVDYFYYPVSTKYGVFSIKVWLSELKWD